MIRLNSWQGTANVLRALRKRRNYSAAGLGHRLGICRSAMYYRERGQTSPDVAGFIAHANALGYDVVLVPRTCSEATSLINLS